MTEHDLPARLRHLGEHHVPAAVRDAHMQRMSAVDPSPPRRREKRFGRLAVAAAALVGFFAGSTGLAMAGALPDPAQGVAHDVLSVVQVEVPDRKPNHGSCVSAAAKQHGDDPAAEAAKKQAIDACKESHPPGRSGGAPGRSGTAGAHDDPCKGKPPWAGPNLTDAEREQRRAEHLDACPGRGVEDEAETPGG